VATESQANLAQTLCRKKSVGEVFQYQPGRKAAHTVDPKQELAMVLG